MFETCLKHVWKCLKYLCHAKIYFPGLSQNVSKCFKVFLKCSKTGLKQHLFETCFKHVLSAFLMISISSVFVIAWQKWTGNDRTHQSKIKTCLKLFRHFNARLYKTCLKQPKKNRHTQTCLKHRGFFPCRHSIRLHLFQSVSNCFNRFWYYPPKFASEAKSEIGIPEPLRALDCGQEVTGSNHQKERSAEVSRRLGTGRTLPGPRCFER